ncbi:uncharacterized protein ASCRUDRAFT_26784, partial [Ascoidea rubescens DSM 1968]
NFMIRIFKEDNTFFTVSCKINTTVSEILSMIGNKKSFLKSIDDYVLEMRIGIYFKILAMADKPFELQLAILVISGFFGKTGPFQPISQDDSAYLIRFSLKRDIADRLLTWEEETKLATTNYTIIDLENMNLKIVPIAIYKHYSKIREFNVSRNPSIFVPKDFIGDYEVLKVIRFENNISGKFPPCVLSAKRGLVELYLGSNLFYEIPQKFGSSSISNTLVKLFLNCNRLSYLPTSFSNFKNLKILDLSSNTFRIFPDQICNLESLYLLDISFNMLTVLPPQLKKLKKLQILNLDFNHLTGALPNYFIYLKNLRIIRARRNNLTDINVLSDLEFLEVLEFDKNNIPTFLVNFKSHRTLQHYEFTESDDDVYHDIFLNLNTLNLSKCKLSKLPDKLLTVFPNLIKLILDSNSIANFPSSIYNLHKLIYLSAHSNDIAGFTDEIEQLESLQVLDLHSNNIKDIPSSIWKLGNLLDLNLSSNLITQFPPPNIPFSSAVNNSRNPSLVLRLANNALSDDCFDPISYLTKLECLNLSYNDLIEVPHHALKRLNNLIHLHLSGNELTNLPADDLKKLKSLKSLYINNNKFRTLPAELANVENLTVLDVGSNQLKYNISNWPFDWNWQWNLKLRYLNFSGNTRLEIKQISSHTASISSNDGEEDSKIRFDSFNDLNHLKILGLMGVTSNTAALIPENSTNLRVRTTDPDVNNMRYGIADTLGQRDYISIRDTVYERFQGNEDEILICLIDGKSRTMDYLNTVAGEKSGHKISQIIQEAFPRIFIAELKKCISSKEPIEDALRRGFLWLNREIHNLIIPYNDRLINIGTKSKGSIFSFGSARYSNKNSIPFDITIQDAFSGCSMTVIYIKDKTLYSANVGDITTILSKSSGSYVPITIKHDPLSVEELYRVKVSGGFVDIEGYIDGVTDVSRAVGFFNLLPHINASPCVNKMKLTLADEMLIIATKELWQYITYEDAIDIMRQDKSNPMIAAQKLRDIAISYGAEDKMTVIILSLEDNSCLTKSDEDPNILSGNDNTILQIKKRRNRFALSEDLNLVQLGNEIDPPIGRVAMVFTDIKSSTYLWDNFPTEMRAAIKTHNEIMRRQLRIVGGYEVKTEGDAFMVSFPTITSALIWCFNVQMQLLKEDWPLELVDSTEGCEILNDEGKIIFRGISVRMGIHLGTPLSEKDVITKRMDYYGPMVNRASRVSAIAEGGQITISLDFLNELHKLEGYYEEVKSGKKSILEVYGNEILGKQLQEEMTKLKLEGYKIFKLGEKKLKGLETPEQISAIYPLELASRFIPINSYDRFQNNLNKRKSSLFQNKKGLENFLMNISNLESLAIRLETVCSEISAKNAKSFMAGSYHDRNINGYRSKETNNVSSLENIITRIENAVSVLAFRQAISAKTGNGLLTNNKGESIDEIL